jgi:hypothetical protein
MTKWVIDGLLTKPGSGHDDPSFVSEPFLTEEGARSFAILLNEKGYTITARIVQECGPVETIVGADLLKWLNPRSS